MSNKDFYTPVDFHNQSLINPRLNPMNTADIEALALIFGSSHKGYVAYDIDVNKFYIWSGTAFTETGGGNTTFFQADTTTFPTANAGDRLIVTDTGTDTGLVLEEWLYSGANWVDVSATAVTGRLVVYNPSTTDTLLKGRGVHLSGSQGTHPNAYYASAISETESMLAGILLDDIPPESTGYMLPYGMATNIPVEFGTDGELSFLAASNPADGTFSTTETSFPNHRVVAGIIIRAHATNGRFLVKIEGGYEVEELHDFNKDGSYANNQALVYNAATSSWRNKLLSAVAFDGQMTSLTDYLTVLANYAPLVNSLIPAQYLPSYVDDIIDIVEIAETEPAATSYLSGDKYFNSTTGRIHSYTGSLPRVLISTGSGTTYDFVDSDLVSDPDFFYYGYYVGGSNETTIILRVDTATNEITTAGQTSSFALFWVDRATYTYNPIGTQYVGVTSPVTAGSFDSGSSPESGKIYVTTSTDLTYRWSGTVMTEVSKSLAIGITSLTAFRGDYGNTAYQHSQAKGNVHDTAIADIPNLSSTLAGLQPKEAGKGLTPNEFTNFYKGQIDGLSAVALSGVYGDLTGKPDLSVYAVAANLSTVATSGSYADLLDKPDLTLYATKTSLATVATSGSYSDLTDKPTLSTVAGTGLYSDLVSKPDLTIYAKSADLATVATSGSYSDLSNKPTLATVAGTGLYSDLLSKPDLTVYATTASLAAVATSGAYGDLTGKPTLATVSSTGAYADLSGTPNLTVYATIASLATVATSGIYSDLTGKPDLSVYALRAELDLADVAFTGAYGDLTGVPDLQTVATTGVYSDLTGRPDLTVYALAANLKTVATTGVYSDLTGKPDLGLYVTISSAGAVGSFVPVNSAGKIDSQYLSINALVPKGSWNASTNMPELLNGTGTNGDAWYVSTAGYVNLTTGDASATQQPTIGGTYTNSSTIVTGVKDLLVDSSKLDTSGAVKYYGYASSDGLLFGVYKFDSTYIDPDTGFVGKLYSFITSDTGTFTDLATIWATRSTLDYGITSLFSEDTHVVSGSYYQYYGKGDVAVCFTGSGTPTYFRIGRDDMVTSIVGAGGVPLLGDIKLTTADIDENSGFLFYTAARVQSDQIQTDWNATTGKAVILNKPSLATVATSGVYSDLTGKPALKTVATTGVYSDLTGRPDLSVYALASSLSSVALTGDYADLSNKPDLNVYATSSSLATVATSGIYSDLSGRPDLKTVATTGAYGDLTGKPDLSVFATIASLATVATSGAYGDLTGKPSLATVATSGSYADLSSKPDLTVFATIASLATVATSGAYGDLTGRPSLATVATSGSYGDLSNKPDLSVFAIIASLATVATSGAYGDLTGKPSLAAVATSGSYADLTNKPKTDDIEEGLTKKYVSNASVYAATITNFSANNNTQVAENDPLSTIVNKLQSQLNSMSSGNASVTPVRITSEFQIKANEQRLYHSTIIFDDNGIITFGDDDSILVEVQSV